MQQWIEIGMAMPDLYTFVLVLAYNKGTDEPKPISIARWDGETWEFLAKYPCMSAYGAWQDMEYGMDSDDITHWMPLVKLIPVDPYNPI